MKPLRPVRSHWIWVVPLLSWCHFVIGKPQATPITPTYDLLSTRDLEIEAMARAESTSPHDLRYNPVWQCRKVDRLQVHCIPTGHRRSELGGKLSFRTELSVESSQKSYLFLIRATLTHEACRGMTREWSRLVQKGDLACFSAESLEAGTVRQLESLKESTWLLSAIKTKWGRWNYFEPEP